jgi:uncharacterized protein (TIGR00369 family)
MDANTYKKLPERQDHNCFGCSPANSAGLQMKFFTNGQSVVTRVTVPDHLCGWDNLVHGGVLSTILDEIMGWAALHLLKKLTLTKSLTVDFLKPAYIGTELKAEGRVLELKSEREVLMEGTIYNPEGILCARSTGLFGLFTAKTLRKLDIMDEEMLNRLERELEG